VEGPGCKEGCTEGLFTAAFMPIPCPASPAAAWIARQVAAGLAPCSPLTNVPLPHTELQTNRVVRRLTAALAAAGLRPEL
jgi:hypothetical protein